MKIKREEKIFNRRWKWKTMKMILAIGLTTLIAMTVVMVILDVLDQKERKIDQLEEGISRLRPLSPPTIYKIVCGRRLEEFIRRESKTEGLIRVDLKYKVTTIEEIRRFLEHDRTDELSGTEFIDCDDFAFRLKGQFTAEGWSGVPIGIIFEGIHAFNIVVVIDDEKRLRLYEIEPQLDVIYPFCLNFCAIYHYLSIQMERIGEVRLVIF